METIDARAAPPSKGLRERKKQEARDAFATAAMQLALKHGLDQIRAEDIAAAANMSVRTFNNYFSNKYEAVAARYIDRMRHTAAILEAWPAADPLWDAIIGSLQTTWGAIESDQAINMPSLAKLRAVLSSRTAQGEIMLTAFAGDNAFTRAVAGRTETQPEDLYPRLVTAAVTAASQVAINLFLEADPPRPARTAPEPSAVSARDRPSRSASRSLGPKLRGEKAC